MFRAAFVLTCITFLIVFSASSSVSQDVDAGQLLFNNACRTCHSVKEGDNRLGPNLYSVLEEKPVRYRTMVIPAPRGTRTSSGTKKTLIRFIANPDAVVHGNNMQPYGGLASADDRAKVIDFLETQR